MLHISSAAQWQHHQAQNWSPATSHSLCAAASSSSSISAASLLLATTSPRASGAGFLRPTSKEMTNGPAMLAQTSGLVRWTWLGGSCTWSRSAIQWPNCPRVHACAAMVEFTSQLKLANGKGCRHSNCQALCHDVLVCSLICVTMGSLAQMKRLNWSWSKLPF